MRDGIAQVWSCALMLFLCSCGNLSHSAATSLIEQSSRVQQSQGRDL